jgi:hypothetical protein
MGSGVSNQEILETLAGLNAGLSRPVWLFGGVAVDFLVGRWTRPHGDIDLNAYASDREALTRELGALGFRTQSSGWLTHWTRGDSASYLEVVFAEPGPDDSGVLVITPQDSIGIPGRYPMIAGYLDPDRRATLGGVTFRVTSAAGEWLARAAGIDIVGGRQPDPKLEHDRLLLESLLSEEELERLRLLSARR